MGIARRVAVFAVQEIAKSLLAAAGTQVGEALGKRIGARIYTPPPESKKPSDSP